MDTAAKREFIKNITDEVKVFHPLLEEIVPKLAGITSYEYTHGQFERGADFVLERTDAALNRKTYIGIVAKTEKITADTHEVEEQIQECAEERRYKILSRVRCPEVWVFCAQGYSERAKEKIEKRFAERTIQFFGPEDLVKFVDDHHPYFWFNLPYQLAVYFQALTRRLHLQDESTSVLNLAEAAAVEIELDTFERTRRGYNKVQRPGDDFRNVKFLEEVRSSRLSVLEAEMGFGKSRLARGLARALCSAESFNKDRLVPVFSSFKMFVDQHKGNLDALINANLGGSVAALSDPSVKIVCILDGLDEINSDYSSTAHAFQAVVDSAKTKSNLQLVITTRPVKSLEQALLLNNDVRLFGIRPLSLAKIVKYLEDCCAKQNLPKRLYEDLKKSPLFRQLPQSPIAAALFSNLLSQNQQEVPQSLTELYAKSMDLMLGRWEQKKNLATEKQFQTAELIAEQLAEFFVDNGLIYMAAPEAQQYVKDYFSRRSIGVSEKDIVSLLFERSNIFSSDPDSGTISFRHRTFAEFLCAKRKYRERNMNVDELALNPAWSTVMFFYAGLRLDCSELLCTVQKLKPRDEFEEWMKIFAVPSYLLAAYQTEFSVVEENAHIVLVDAAKLYLKVRRGETKTSLTSLSEMQLLYIFKLLVVDALSYKYFERAFDSIVLHIQNSENDDEVKHYALFFLGCAAADLGNESVFKYILEDIGAEKLPLQISLAARMELESHTNLDKSPLLRSHRARLQRMLFPPKKRKDPVTRGEATAVQNAVDELYDKPIKSRLKKLKLEPARNRAK